MVEENVAAKAFIVNYRCDDCGEGFMGDAEMVHQTNSLTPLTFRHKCSKCGKVKRLPHKYPYPRFVPTVSTVDGYGNTCISGDNEKEKVDEDSAAERNPSVDDGGSPPVNREGDENMLQE